MGRDKLAYIYIVFLNDSDALFPNAKIMIEKVKAINSCLNFTASFPEYVPWNLLK